MPNTDLFQGRKLLIATKHHKDMVIAPILERALGVTCFVLPDFDSDVLGTFTGEIDRVDDPLVTAKNKCLLAMQKASCDLAVASEGSFGPHPSMVFTYADDEFLLLYDAKHELEIFVRILTTETNFMAREIRSKAELKEFCLQAQFPTHAVILRKHKDDFENILKGIQQWDVLTTQCEALWERYGSAYIETDMRAMYNPTRMQVIEKITQKLADKVNSVCPVCSTPGLGITAIKEGLPCQLCHQPTSSILSHVYECQRCDYVKEIKFPNRKEVEDPMYCNFCNP